MSDSVIEPLNARLQEMGNAAEGAERSLQTACRALREIQSLCDVELPGDAAPGDVEAAKSNAARADVSLDAVADEIERVTEALRSVAGLDE